MATEKEMGRGRKKQSGEKIMHFALAIVFPMDYYLLIPRDNNQTNQQEADEMKIKDMKQGEFFKLAETTKKVYVRGSYDRYKKRYSCTEFEDTNKEIFLPGEKEVFAGDCFTF